MHLSIYVKYTVGLLMSTLRCFVLNKSVVMSLRPSAAPPFWVKGTTYFSCHIESVYCFEKQWL